MPITAGITEVELPGQAQISYSPNAADTHTSHGVR